MSELITVFVAALGVGADAFAVSICNAMTKSNLTKAQFIAYPICFGLFQGLMPLAGYYIGSAFSEWITILDHWIALILLSFIGGKMIYENIKAVRSGNSSGEHISGVYSFGEMIIQGFSTSVDAMVVGIMLALTVTLDIFISVSVIAVIAFLMSLVGMIIGKRVGRLFSDYAGIAGGVILILIGLKIFIEHAVNHMGAI